METPLSALGIQNGCRVMLIGKKVNCFFHQNTSESNDEGLLCMFLFRRPSRGARVGAGEVALSKQM